MKPRVVLDTNIMVSGLLGGTATEVIRRWRAGAFGLIRSQEIMAEYEAVLFAPPSNEKDAPPNRDRRKRMHRMTTNLDTHAKTVRRAQCSHPAHPVSASAGREHRITERMSALTALKEGAVSTRDRCAGNHRPVLSCSVRWAFGGKLQSIRIVPSWQFLTLL